MTAKGQDIRITKTQRALSIAMLSLLEKNSFQKITVNDICQEALVSRSTFYTHFEDKYMLLQFCMQELGSMMMEKAQTPDPQERMRASLQAIYDHARVYHNIFLADPNRELLSMIRRHFTTLVSTIIKKHDTGNKLLDNTPELIALYCAGGVSALIGWWIEEDFPVSVDEMAACQHALLRDTIAGQIL